jgi:hypothetical protein
MSITSTRLLKKLGNSSSKQKAARMTAGGLAIYTLVVPLKQQWRKP